MQNGLKIALDVAPMRYPYSGVRTYVEALIAGYRNRDAGIEITPLAPPYGLTRLTSRVRGLGWDFEGMADSAMDASVDVLHVTRFAAPRSSAVPLVVTVHDLIPLVLPEYRASKGAVMQSELAKCHVPHANRIIVPSRHVALDVEKLLGVDPERIDVIPMGVAVPGEASLPRVVTGPYLVHTGGFDARKNLPMLLRAFARAAPQLGPEWRLVLVGAPHSGNPTVYPPIWPTIDEMGLQKRVLLTGRISEREKHAIYRHARMAVNPSRSEGFGLPILEAMAHGVPVIASNLTSHPEVAGNAAVLIDATVDSFSDAILRLATDEALCADLSCKGRARAALFSWPRTAHATIAAYRRAVMDQR